MDIVIYTITWIRCHGSDHRKFSALFNESDAQYGSMFCSMELKWLNHGEILRHFFELLEEIDFFMTSKGKAVPQLMSKDWVRDSLFGWHYDVSKHVGYFSARMFTNGDTNVWFTSLIPSEIVSLGDSFGKEQSGPLFYAEISFWKWKGWTELHSPN